MGTHDLHGYYIHDNGEDDQDKVDEKEGKGKKEGEENGEKKRQ